MSLIERSRENQAIVYRDSRDGSLVWDTLPTGHEADRLINERISHGLVPIASGTQAEALKAVNVSQQKKKIL